MMDTEFEILPGQIVGVPGQGLAVIVGKKSFEITDPLNSDKKIPTNTWETRPLSDLSKSSNIPEQGMRKRGVFLAPDRETLEPILQQFLDEDGFDLSGIPDYAGGRYEAVKAALNSANLSEVAKGLAASSRLGLTPKTNEENDLINKGARILGEYLFLATRLSPEKSTEHILALAKSKNQPENAWPEDHTTSRHSRMSEKKFTHIFGISFSEAQDLAQNPASQTSGKNLISILNDLERSAKDEFDAAKPDDSADQEHDTDTAPADDASADDNEKTIRPFKLDHLVADRGSGVKNYAFAKTVLEDEDLELLAYVVFVKPDFVKFTGDLAEEFGLSREEIERKLEDIAYRYAELAIQADHPEFVTGKLKKLSSRINALVGDQEPTPKPGSNPTQGNAKPHEMDSIVAMHGSTRRTYPFAKTILNDIELKILTYRLFATPENRKTISELAATFDTGFQDMRIAIEQIAYKYGYHALKSGNFKFVTGKLQKISPDLETLKENQDFEKRIPIDFNGFDALDTDAANNHDAEEPEDIEDTSNDPEAQIMLIIKKEGFSAQTLEQLGDVYRDQQKLEKAVWFYGSALALDDNNLNLAEKLNAVETATQTEFDIDVHWKEVEAYIDEYINGEHREAFLDADAEMSSDKPELPDGEDDSLVIDAEYIEVVPGTKKQKNSSIIGRNGGGRPQVNIAVPAGVLESGARLKMTFGHNAKGELVVTMEGQSNYNQAGQTPPDNAPKQE